MKRLLIISIVVFLWLEGAALEAQDGQCSEMLGYADVTDTSCHYHDRIHVDINYPRWIQDYDFTRTPIEAFLTETLEDFWLSGIPHLRNVDAFLEITYEEFAYAPNVQSIVFEVYTFNGAVSYAALYFQSYVFDLEKRQQLTLMDLFQPNSDPLTTIAPLVQEDLTEQIFDAITVPVDPITVEIQIEEGAAATLENYRVFAITDDGLLFFFEPYRVSFPTLGSFRVAVPFDNFTDILAPEFQTNE